MNFGREYWHRLQNGKDQFIYGSEAVANKTTPYQWVYQPISSVQT